MLGIDPQWDLNKRCDEHSLLAALTATANLSADERADIAKSAADLVRQVRGAAQPGLMEAFLAEYGLSTQEGIALMCLAEALLRVPDQPTIDALIEDKIAASDWSHHLGQASSPLVNASTWGLMLTGKVLDEPEAGIAGTLRSMVRKLGEPVIRTATGAAMREMGRQFVLGQTIDAAMERAAKQEAQGLTYSYDMLGEGALTMPDAQRYAHNYARAINAIAAACTHDNVAANPGISVKLSALHPRYEVAHSDRLIKDVVPVVADLAASAAAAGMGLNIDAEEADRLGLSLAVIDEVLKDPRLVGWNGFGVVVQAYSRRAGDVIKGLHAMAQRHDRQIMVRLVKGAYWDTEIKHAQVQGLNGSPVFTRKVATDVSYLAHARQLLALTDHLYPQFATHNAHTMAGVLHMAKGISTETYEFQRLHGMGETLHALVKSDAKTRCRIYAPVGAHRDLLAYLVRRLLENGANSSFVNQIVDHGVPAEMVATCPFETLAKPQSPTEPSVVNGPDLFAPQRANARGFDLSDTSGLAQIMEQRRKPVELAIEPILATKAGGANIETITNPATGSDMGTVKLSSMNDVVEAFDTALLWNASPRERSTVLNTAADLFEEAYAEVFSLLACEAGKTLVDCVGELREAVDFLRYYAAQSLELDAPARGIISCISPWNFPLAIFTGQVAAALAAGNAVLAKPAETTPAIAALSVKLLHKAGVPRTALQLLPGHGASVGMALTSDPRLAGVAFTGSTGTAQRIQTSMARHCAPGTPLIAETGGLNAMIVDSTALPEQAVRDIVSSAFQSAGQRCSALRYLYVQEDVAETIKTMLVGAMNELTLGDPWELSTDCGPVITCLARKSIIQHIDAARQNGRLIHALEAPTTGHFVGPALIQIDGIHELESEVFGPVLHITTYAAKDLDRVIQAINATGYGLTFGMHSRIDDRVQQVSESVDVGNIYINRNQIGAIVGSQPFGGHGLSGTGPKAGGPNYVPRFTRTAAQPVSERWDKQADVQHIETALHAAAQTAQPAQSQELPGPTGELNVLSMHARAPILCLGPGAAAAGQQAASVTALGGIAVVADGALPADALTTLSPLGGVMWWGAAHENKRLEGRCFAAALADREGAIVPLITDMPDRAHAQLERHLSVDTTAAGGNVSLLSGSA